MIMSDTMGLGKRFTGGNLCESEMMLQEMPLYLTLLRTVRGAERLLQHSGSVS